MAKSLVSGLILTLWPKFRPGKNFCRFYFYYMLDIVISYHCMQFQRKLMDHTQVWFKNLVFGLILAQIWAVKKKNFLSKIWLHQSRYYGQLSSCTIPENTNDPILRGRSNRWTSWQTDRGTEGQKWFHGTLLE